MTLFKSIMTIIQCCCLIAPISAYADQTIINNNAQTPYPVQPQCNNGYSTNTGTPPGTYQVQNGNGTTSTVYTTGDKQPYIVDNNCNQNQTIQPYVYVQPPMPGPGPGPGPFKGKMQGQMPGNMQGPMQQRMPGSMQGPMQGQMQPPMRGQAPMSRP